ncbi:RING-type domain-containing protein [Aphelenchoides besseyi]|nr:RING-type domain-containing protein [Aphelenchoides besseyi]
MSREQRNHLKQLTECPVCYSTLLDPRILQCGHSVCGECATKLSDDTRDQGLDEFECPECRRRHPINIELPRDFRLKQIIEQMSDDVNNISVMNLQGEHSDSSIVPEKTKCRRCKIERDGGEIYVCTTCSNDFKAGWICSVCVLKHHRMHDVRSLIDAFQLKTLETTADNKNLIEKISVNSEFYFNRYNIQKEQVVLIVQSLKAFCDQLQTEIEENFSRNHIQLAATINRYLDEIFNEMNTILNEADNLIFAMCMKILSNFQRHFRLPNESMEMFKHKITANETVDLHSLLSTSSGLLSDSNNQNYLAELETRCQNCSTPTLESTRDFVDTQNSSRHFYDTQYNNGFLQPTTSHPAELSPIPMRRSAPTSPRIDQTSSRDSIQNSNRGQRGGYGTKLLSHRRQNRQR